MGWLLVAVLIGFLVTAIQGYTPHAQEHTYLTDSILREVVERMSRDLAVAADSYLDSTEQGFGRNYAPSRGMKDVENEEPGYPINLEGLEPPSLRDREFLQHSSLWGNQFIAGGSGEGPQRLKPDGSVLSQQQMKADPTLPAYCNPPNPCPVGYSSDDGCLEQFDNTAAFSRKFQGEQECMCDTEHMFDCPIHDYGSPDLDMSPMMPDLDFDDAHKNLVAKKFHTKKASNPFLEGERLPIAAKKGQQLPIGI